jgi:hypothetical protein
VIVCENSVRIERPIEAVYAFVAEGFFQNLKVWNPDLVALELVGDGAMKPGARAHESQLIQGKKFERDIEVTDLVAPKLFAIKSVGSPQQPGEHAVNRFTFTPDGSGTRIDYRFELIWKGFMFTWTPWLPKMFINKALSRNLGTMKTVLESQST